MSERVAHIESRKQIVHWECNTVIETHRKQAIVTVEERKSGYAVITEFSNKTVDLVGAAIIDMLEPFDARRKTPTYDDGEELGGRAKIDEALSSTGYFARVFAS